MVDSSLPGFTKITTIDGDFYQFYFEIFVLPNYLRENYYDTT